MFSIYYIHGVNVCPFCSFIFWGSPKKKFLFLDIKIAHNVSCSEDQGCGFLYYTPEGSRLLQGVRQNPCQRQNIVHVWFLKLSDRECVNVPEGTRVISES